MANFDDGIKAFIIGECTIKVHFPIDWKDNIDVSCYQCRFFSRNNGICQITKEISEYPTRYIGSKCPLNFSGEILENKKEKNNETD